MKRKPISYENALSVASMWRNAGGSPEVELGALEPLLWKEGKRSIEHLIHGLVSLGNRVNMTTNASFLDQKAQALKDAGLSLLRISWHTSNPYLFKDLSGGYGDYERFYRGITTAAEIGLPLSFNRVLIKGFTEDLEGQLDFIERYGLRLKLYDLMWTPQIAKVYEDIYVDWRDVVSEIVVPRSVHIEKIGKKIGRTRIRYHLNGGGFVEVKQGDIVDRSKYPCNACAVRKECLEDFGDYARVDPDLNFYSCYMRKDIGFNLEPCLAGEHGYRLFRAYIQTMVGRDISVDDFLQNAALRFTLMPRCNFNCRVPGTNHSWCMEEPGEYIYPRMKPSIFNLKKG